MKGLILAAGKGSRLRPLTNTRPKPLVPIAGRPILQYNIENLRDAGITDIVVVINANTPQVQEHFGDGSTLGVRLTYVGQEKLIGTANAVYTARNAIGDEPFVLVFGDNMTGYRLSRLVRDYQRHGGGSLLALSEDGDWHKQAVVSVEGDRVVKIEERPDEARSPLLRGMRRSTSAFSGRSSGFSRWPTASITSHAIQVLVDEGIPVHYTLADGWRVNINTPQDMLQALQ